MVKNSNIDPINIQLHKDSLTLTYPPIVNIWLVLQLWYPQLDSLIPTFIDVKHEFHAFAYIYTSPTLVLTSWFLLLLISIAIGINFDATNPNVILGGWRVRQGRGLERGFEESVWRVLPAIPGVEPPGLRAPEQCGPGESQPSTSGAPPSRIPQV